MIIGRVKEKKQLENACKSKEAEFIVVYGRRRVGKTYLVREFFSAKKCLFMHVTGVDKGNIQTQLSKFTEAIASTFFNNAPLETPASWNDAFQLLHKQIITQHNKRIVIFLDELPWLVTKRSGLLQTIDHYWNHYWSQLKNVVFIVCGSSASWIIKNIIYAKGGLHNRASAEIRLLPFTLIETKEFLKYRKINLNDRHILTLYMTFGGVPYYLKYIESGLTAEQNIQNILFANNAPLRDEFRKLFQSLFNNANAYIELIKLLAKSKAGMLRNELQTAAKLSTNGGRLTARLNDLCRAGFIEEHIPWQKKTGEYYKVIDEFCLFYLNWLDSKKNMRFTQSHWLEQSKGQAYAAWSGYAFESICLKHIEQIITTLNIKAGGTISSWRFVPRKTTETGAQIDLLIDRNDDAITICEIKYTAKPFSIDKQYAKNLLNKVKVFQQKTKTKKQIFIAMISANGLKTTSYSEELISNVVTLDDLFLGS